MLQCTYGSQRTASGSQYSFPSGLGGNISPAISAALLLCSLASHLCLPPCTTVWGCKFRCAPLASSFPCGFWLWTLELGSSGLPRKHFCLSSQVSAPRSGIFTSTFPDHFICNFWATLYFLAMQDELILFGNSLHWVQGGMRRDGTKSFVSQSEWSRQQSDFYSPSGCLASYPVCCAAENRCCQVWKFIYTSRFHFNDFLPLFTILASDDCWYPHGRN